MRTDYSPCAGSLFWIGEHISPRLLRRSPDYIISCHTLIASRYIAVESGSQPSLTRPRTHYLNEHLKPTLCPTHEPDSDRNSPTFRLARLVEASSLLDKIHNTLNSPTAEDAFNDEELILTAQTAINLQTILNEDIGGGVHLYAGGLALCQT